MKTITNLLLIRETLGQNIRTRRESLNISLEEAARQIGLTPGFLALVERGRRNLSIEKLQTLSDLLDVSTDDLFGKTNTKEQ